MSAPRAFKRQPMPGMSHAFPMITILVRVSDMEEAQMHFQDLTSATGHKAPATRLFHVMFDDDLDKANLVLDLMSTNFQNYYDQLLTAELVDSQDEDATNPLRLPSIDGTINDQFAKLQVYLKGLYHSPICDPGFCPCSTMLVTACCPEATAGTTVGCHADCMPHNMTPAP
jgi:hypothetical protein